MIKICETCKTNFAILKVVINTGNKQHVLRVCRACAYAIKKQKVEIKK